MSLFARDLGEQRDWPEVSSCESRLARLRFTNDERREVS